MDRPPLRIDVTPKHQKELANLLSGGVQQVRVVLRALALLQLTTYDRFSKLNGAEFDRAYMKDVVADHRMDVTEFKHEANSGSDPDVKAFASKTLPALEKHLQMAESTEANVRTGKK